MRKIYELDSHFATGEATVQPVLLWGRNGQPLYERFTKTASEASDYIKAVEPKPGMSIVLVLALGAYERYDLNRNGDGFNEFPYKVGFKPTCGCCAGSDGWVEQSEVLTSHYQSFETDGKVYRHHQNKDPLKAVGDVIKSFWNPYMHRVELLIGLRNELAPDLAQRIADGEFPAVSMGCRIKYDVCTICGHHAPTRKQYCDHLKFHMRQVMPNGLRAGALNPSPKFFDISWVIKPADQTGFMLKKVAEEAYDIRTSSEMGDYLDRVEEKRAALRKIADIDKVIRGIPVDHKTSPLSEGEARNIKSYHANVRPALARMPEMDPTTITDLAKHPIAEVLSTLSAAGVILTTPEFVKLLLNKLAPGAQIDEGTLDAIVAMQGQVFELFAQHPQMLDQLTQTGMFDIQAKNVRPEIAVKAERYLEKRSHISDYMYRALVPPQFRAEEPPWTDTLHISDPSTGDRYATTRGAARDAHDEIAKKQLAKMLGGTALLGAGYKVVSSGLPSALKPLALATAGMVGYRHLRPDMGPHYMSDEGIEVPTLTELQKSGNELASTALPILGSAALVEALGHDYESRLRRGMPTDDPNAPIHRRLIDRLSQFASEHPALSMIGSLGAYGMGKHTLNKFAELMEGLLDAPTDSVVLPDVDIDRAAEKLGSVVCQ